MYGYQLDPRAASLQKRFEFHHDMGDIVGRRVSVKIDPEAFLLTDDFSPANYLNAIGRHNAPRW